jgi:hypothetical protein
MSAVMTESLPQIRFAISVAARILRLSRATLYERIRCAELNWMHRTAIDRYHRLIAEAQPCCFNATALRLFSRV